MNRLVQSRNPLCFSAGACVVRNEESHSAVCVEGIFVTMRDDDLRAERILFVGRRFPPRMLKRGS
jgi:hypothetical protein